MDIKKSLNKVVNLNGYINFTQELTSTRKEIIVPFNMSTVLTLKRIRSLEVEYFSKIQESGAAFLILERIVTFPPSKTWSLLSVEIVNLLNDWLEAVRKYIITHCPLWWNFFQAVLGFISEIRLKDISVSNIILKQSAVALLDLGTSDKLDREQRSKVVACLNQLCYQSSRDVRVALQESCAPYLVKLASEMATCSIVPTQFAIIELLMRWLPNRQDRKVREAAAARWFPATLYTEKTVEVFLERSFDNFFKDARAFLTQHNSASGDIVSVVCRKLTVGRLELISLSDKWESWLDIGLTSGHLTAMVDVRRLPILGLPLDSREHITLTADNAHQAILYRGPTQIQLSITTISQPQLICKETQQLLDEQACDVNIWISTKSHFDSVDLALRKIFGDKYKCDENRRLSELIYSSDSNKYSASEEDTRLSAPTEVPKQKRIGCAVAPRRASGWKSPSTVSTTSLACLSKKLSAIPRRRYDKELSGICVTPDLSCVTEISEPDDDSNYTFTGKTRPCGVPNCSKTKPRIVNRSKTSPSDNDEGVSSKRGNVSPVVNAKRKHATPVSEPAKKIDSAISPNCLLSAATLGAYEASIINDTLEAIQLEDDDDVINLLAKEAFATVKEKDVLQDSGIKVSDKKTPSSAVETRANVELIRNTNKNKSTVPCTVISKSSSEDTSTSFQNVINFKNSYLPGNKGEAGSNVLKSTTTDESNTEAINETPLPIVYAKTLSLKGKKRARATSAVSERNFKNIGQANVLNKTVIELESSPQQFAANDIEDFFSQVQENKNGDIILSPTLARRVNETPSDTSDSFDKYLITNVGGQNHLENNTEFYEEQNFVDPEDVLGCLNQIIDKVCEDLDKCTEYMEKEARTKSAKNTPIKSTEKTVEIDSDFIPDTISSTMNPLAKEKEKISPIKLAFKNAKAKKVPIRKNKRKNTKNTSPIKKTVTPEALEVNSDIELNNPKEVTSDPKPAIQSVATKNVPAKRKRKLYSPKDADKQNGINVPETEEDNPLSADINPKLYTPKTTATSYKEIFKVRKNRKDEPKSAKINRKRGKASKSPPMSPRSIKKNEMFDKLKENVENVPIKQVDMKSKGRDLTVYNYTSESEDEDFQAKKTTLHINKGTPIGSTGSKRTTRSRINYSESRNESSAEDGPSEKRVPKRKKAKQPTKSKKEVTKIIKEPIRDVIDERMRATAESALNTSFVLNETHEYQHDSDLEPLSKLVKKMEPIPEVSIIEEDIVKEVVEPKKVSKRRCERVLSLKKDENKQKKNVDSSANEDSSPLPALIIEPVKTGRKDTDADSISSSKLIKNCENVIKFGEDADTTQNLLLDDDKICNSPEIPNMPIELEIRQNLDATNDDRIDICNDNAPRKNKSKSEKEVSLIKKFQLSKEAIVLIKKETDILQRKTAKPNNIAEAEVIEIKDNNTEAESQKRSISTVGNSPIRAHVSLNEDPPNATMLKQQLNTPRDVDYDMSPSMKNFFIQLYKEINSNPVESKENESPQEIVAKMITRKQAKTPLTKTQRKEIILPKADAESDKNLQYTSQIKPIPLSSPVVLLERSFDSSKKKSIAEKPASLLSIASSPSLVLKRLDPGENNVILDKSIDEESLPENYHKTMVSNRNKNTKKRSLRTKPEEIVQSESEDNGDTHKSKDQTKFVVKKVVTTRNAKRALTKKQPKEVIISETEDEFGENVQTTPICLSSSAVRLERSSDNLKTKPIVKMPASLLSTTTSPSIVLKRLSPEAIRKWLPSPKSTISEESREVINVLNKTQKTIKSTEKVKTTKTVLQKTKDTPIGSTKISVKKLEQNNSKTKTLPFRKSTISPIKDFDELKPSEPTDVQSKSITSLTKFSTQINKDNDQRKNRTPRNTRDVTETVASSSSEIINGKDVNQLDRNSGTTPVTSELSIDEHVVKPNARKRQAALAVDEPKKIRIDIEASVKGQASSGASEWLQQCLDMSMENPEQSATVDCLQMILEKLDTTLSDIQHNTSKNMVAFLVDDHRRSQELTKLMNTDLQSRFAQLMSQYNERWSTLIAEHHRARKAAAADLVRADSLKKQALVKILREDVQAVLNHINRKS